ncbi:MAG TPA: DUF3618 domain-containing protein [Acidimicrobiales bacterium]
MGKNASEVRHDIDMTRREMAGTIDELTDRASPRRAVNRRRQRAAERLHSMRTAVMGEPDGGFGPEPGGGGLGGAREMAGSARGAVQGTGEQVGQIAGQARQAPDIAKRKAQGNPIAAGLIAFGGGLLASSILPSTEPEQRAAKTLKERTQGLQEEMRQAGQEVADQVKSSAKERAGEVKQTSTEAAEEVKGRAQTSAQQVQEEARGGGAGTR